MILTVEVLESNLKRIFNRKRIPKSINIYANGEISYIDKYGKRGTIYDKLFVDCLLNLCGYKNISCISYRRGLFQTYITRSHFIESSFNEKEFNMKNGYTDSVKSVKYREVKNNNSYSFLAFLFSFAYYLSKRSWVYGVSTLVLSIVLPLEYYFGISLITSLIYYLLGEKRKETRVYTFDLVVSCVISVLFLVLKIVQELLK